MTAVGHDAVYRVYFHGPAYQVLDHAWRANGHVIGALAGDLPPDHEPAERVTDFVPRLIELCFQTAGVWELGTAGRMALPTHVDRVTRYAGADAPGPPVGRRDAARRRRRRRGGRRQRARARPARGLPDDRAARRRSIPTRSRRSAPRWATPDMQRPFRRLAIVNRGEPAMRVIHAVRELNEERDDPIRLIALCTEPERQAMFVRHADEAVCIGPALVGTGDGGRRSGYLDYPALERALVAARADAAWVGWGFVAEHPQFVELCERLGIVFVGPDAATMRLVGDKIEAKRLAEQAGVPVAPWSGGPVATAADAIGHAQRIGYPLMIKAAAGGGGRGIRRVDAADELAAAFESARAEALQAFGDGTLLMEQLVTPARHVEVQVIADGQGVAWAVGLRDCSYQRRNQKVIEESASPALTPAQEQRDDGGGAAARAARRLPQRRHRRVPLRARPASASPSWRSTPACRSSTP